MYMHIPSNVPANNKRNNSQKFTFIKKNYIGKKEKKEGKFQLTLTLTR